MLITVWKIGQMVSIVDIACEITEFIKIGFGRVLVDTSKFSGSQGQLEVLVHIMASPFLIPSALLGPFIPTPAVRQFWVTWTVPGTSKGKVMPCTQKILLPMNLF